MTDDNSSSPASPEDPHLADPTMSLFVKEDAPPSSSLRELEALMLSRVESVGLDSVAQAIGGSAGELFKSYKQDVKKWAELLGLLGLQVSHEPSGSSPAQPYAPLSAPAILQLGEPEEVYRHLDYLRQTKLSTGWSAYPVITLSGTRSGRWSALKCAMPSWTAELFGGSHTPQRESMSIEKSLGWASVR